VSSIRMGTPTIWSMIPVYQGHGIGKILARAGPSENRVMRLQGGGPGAKMVCGGCDLANQAHRSFFSFLPKMLHLREG
jgi:hypothetical protein